MLLIWRMLGWACLLGILALVVTQLINIVIARYQLYFEKKRRTVTDEKLQRTTQFIESIRHLRWYGWQDAWLKNILESRQKELHLRVIQIFFSTTLAFILRFGSGLFPAVVSVNLARNFVPLADFVPGLLRIYSHGRQATPCRSHLSRH
jgi:ABC-type transport system involved in cytochrome bd biosynthesis fused ATPase/permease subunit